MAFTAVTNDYPTPVAWLLFTSAVIWTTAYDTLYAMADREEDIKNWREVDCDIIWSNGQSRYWHDANTCFSLPSTSRHQHKYELDILCWTGYCKSVFHLPTSLN